jgi:hypothetical protein
MQHQLPAIDFTSQAEVRSQAEHRRTEEITGLLKLFFGRWGARFRLKQPTFNEVRYAQMSTAVGNGGLTPSQS